ncbi:DUF3168 domain-containing protein [Sphingobium sp. WCS2017Hpa-17]|uniref:DUF3168 domain-containing protein n=1 Tax=Sphingobium sp. WCS2017Hpa-17 TaxID=3073638 RepID=UPI00288BB33F|nr:DUF3168 domain-containing protein [Sphingobium sp. WCS2017Hpa-17]
MEEALRAKLRATAALTALVGTRIDWGLRGTGAGLPAVRLFEISGGPRMNMSGGSAWTRCRVQIDCLGRTYKAARDIADILAKPPTGILSGMRETVSGVRLRTFIMNRRADTDEDAEGIVHRTSIDAMVWHAAD